METILVPGGLGYIGSHTVLDIFLNTKYIIYIVDDLSNCKKQILDRIKIILSNSQTEQEINRRIKFTEGNVLNLEFLQSIFKQQIKSESPISTIMHFAGKKCVPQSTLNPILYYQNNFVGSLNLFKCMQKFPECTNFIFSSTAVVYGQKHDCTQTDNRNPINPYAETKMCVQMLMKSLSHVHPNWKLICLRYFNPCSSHPSGLIGDEPSVFPNNLFPYMQQVIIGAKEKLYIYGSDYNTHDGTGVRDYIHIMDLSSGHVAALNKLKQLQNNFEIYNLGTGIGLSVLDILKGFQKVLGRQIPYEIVGRRPGDVSILVAKVGKANQKLKWFAQKSLEQMCRDSYNYIVKQNK